MNRQEKDVLKVLLKDTYTNQRVLAEKSGYSLGTVNKCVKSLVVDGYLDEQMRLTDKAIKDIQEKSPQSAIILAAGYGMRMVPLNTELPKGLLEVHGEPLIERLIKQLHEVHIYDIYIVVGFMKEAYEYLIDKYEVQLVVNREYAVKNNLHSIKLVTSKLSKCYVMPCDVWCKYNPFQEHELYSWYMVSDAYNKDSYVRLNRKRELIPVSEYENGNAMIGIAYLLEEDADIVRARIKKMCESPRFDNSFWEEALYEKNKFYLQANVVSSEEVVEINTYEQLRELDCNSNQLKTEAIQTICEALEINNEDITNITLLKKGMTNRSFLFTGKHKRYIMRIPGEGTEQLINRTEEALVYQQILGRQISDCVIYINPKNGYKITEYWDNVRTCDATNRMDLEKCMKKLREFHESDYRVEHEFDIYEKIDFYESLWENNVSIYKDYYETKQNVQSLREYVDSQTKKKVLTHIDAVPDNFLFVRTPDGEEEVRLIDWEYAGMQDPHVDVAMFCIYALYNKEEIDRLIDIYFENECAQRTRIKIYCYIAMCGLLWSNWCEYKRQLGVDFGEYSLRQYRYAKEFYRIVKKEFKIMEVNNGI